MKKTVDRLIIVGREGWGNIDFVEHAQRAAKLGIKVNFVGYPPSAERGVPYIPEISVLVRSDPFTFSHRAARAIETITARSSPEAVAIHVRYYKASSLLSCLIRRPSILDIRTGSIKPSPGVRRLENYLIGIESRYFMKTTVISQAIAALVGVRRHTLLPIGAPAVLLEIPRKPYKTADQLRFIYVGSLVQRNIGIFATAFFDFTRQWSLDWTLTIYGYGSTDDVSMMENLSRAAPNINYLGYLPRNEFSAALSNNDVGVSYVPITPFFSLQPPTKTYEYLMAGLPTLATNTIANAEIVAPKFGWVYGDGYDDIKQALADIRDTYGTKLFDRDFLIEHTWDAIFDRHYAPSVLSRRQWLF